MPLEIYLDKLTTNINDLPAKLKLAGIRRSNIRKSEMVRLLNEYLSKTENILNIWYGLNDFEKEFLEEFIRANGSLDYDDKKEILTKHNRKSPQSTYNIENYFDEGSKVKLLLIKNKMPNPIFSIINDLVKPVELKFNTFDNDKVENIGASIICVGESFEKDFLSTAKLANNLKIKTTKENNYPTKSSVIKINELLENKEILLETNIKDIRNFTQTTRIFGIISLMLSSKIIKTQGDNIIPGKNFNLFVQNGTIDRAKMLLEEYINSKDIDELTRIKELRSKTAERNMSFSTCRKIILEYISKCPINKWVNVTELKKFLKKNHRAFLRDVTGEIKTYNEYDRYYNIGQHDWMEIEGRFVEVSLLEYLSTIGMVDVTVDECSNNYGTLYYLSAGYFRLTKLGAYLLNINDDYELPDEKTKTQIGNETGFKVETNFEIIVPDSIFKYKHCMFFDKFAEKVKEDIATVYKLSFKSMVNALDNDISIQEIIEYIHVNCNNMISENVLTTLQQWKLDSKKIRIRKTTIVECDDEYLLNELKSYKNIKKSITGDLKYAFEIESSQSNKIKREIEKKNHLCIID